MFMICVFFFFQAEDGIRDDLVTGVQTCALPIYAELGERADGLHVADQPEAPGAEDRKSTRLNSSHQIISYAVFCLKKKKKQNNLKSRTKKKQITQTNTA